MKNKIFIFSMLIAITILGGFLRFYKNTENPPSLNGDEISFGYSAYSVLKTGKDENGKFMPITFQSVGDYKNPLPAYLMALAIKLFGFNDFSVRFPNAFFGTLMIPIFFLFLIKIFKNKLIAFLGAFFMAISSWHIYYSRYAYETLIASFFVLLGVWFFMNMLEGKRIWAVLSGFFLTLTMYTAFAPRLFIPIFVIIALVFNFNKVKANRDKIIVFILTCILIGLPLAYVSLFQRATTRLTMVFISNDVNFVRYGIFHDIQSVQELPLLLFFWLRRYLSYLEPNFLFLNGLNLTNLGTIGLGLLYPFELPFLILGVIELIKRRIPYKAIFVIWLLTGIIPDSLTNNQQYAGRLLQIVPVVVIITVLGAIKLFRLIVNLSNRYIKILTSGLLAVFITLVLIHAFLIIAVDSPMAKGESFDEGLKEVALYVRDHQNSYKEIVIDPKRGIDGPYLISNPYLYILFYTEYDPHTYQVEPKIRGSGSTYLFKFNKYTFRDIDWRKDRDKKNTLFIGSPWSLPEKDIKKSQILKRIYLSSGQLAFFIVSSE